MDWDGHEEWRYGLHADEKTLTLLYELGVKGATKTEIARVLNRHPKTLRYFLRREPRAAAVLAHGEAEGRRRRFAESGDAPPDPAPLAGEKACPLCGGQFGRPAETVTLTRAELDDARRAFDELVDRHLAARVAVPGEGHVG